MEEPDAGTIADAYQQEVRENLREWVVKALGGEPGARMDIQTVGLDVRLFPLGDLTNPPENRQRIPVAPAVESVGDLTLPLEQWSPNSKYELHPSRETIQIDVEKPASGTVTLQLSTDALLSLNPSEHPIPNAHVMKLRDALREAADKDLGMQDIRARRRSARERRTDLESRAKEVLSLAREVLFAWTIVSLEGAEHGEVPPADGLRSWFPAVPTGTSRKTESGYWEQWTEAKQRDALMRDYSPSGLFVREVRHLWDLIVRRQLGEHQMRATAEPLDVPESVTEAAAFAVEALHEELQTLDEQIASLQARAIAWKVREAKETGTISLDSVTSETSSPWTGRESTDYAVDLLQEWERGNHVVEQTSDLIEVLAEAGYKDDAPNRLRSIQRALNLDWTDGDGQDFLRTLESALRQVGEYPPSYDTHDTP